MACGRVVPGFAAMSKDGIEAASDLNVVNLPVSHV